MWISFLKHKIMSSNVLFWPQLKYFRLKRRRKPENIHLSSWNLRNSTFFSLKNDSKRLIYYQNCDADTTLQLKLTVFIPPSTPLPILPSSAYSLSLLHSFPPSSYARHPSHTPSAPKSQSIYY